MSARDRHEFEYKRQLETEEFDAETDPAPRPGQRSEHQGLWVDLQIRAAMERGEFDDLPGAGKPLPGIDGTHDPDWWVKKLVEREQLAVLPAALALRREDAELDEQLDRCARAEDVRQTLEDFNHRVVEARRQLQGGPPVITPVRDVDVEVERWTERRNKRLRKVRQQADAAPPSRRRGRLGRLRYRA